MRSFHVQDSISLNCSSRKAWRTKAKFHYGMIFGDLGRSMSNSRKSNYSVLRDTNSHNLATYSYRCRQCLAETVGNCHRKLSLSTQTDEPVEAAVETSWPRLSQKSWQWRQHWKPGQHGSSAPTSEALVASVKSEEKSTPSPCPMELTERSLLLLEDLELETQSLPVCCCCDELRTVPTQECT